MFYIKDLSVIGTTLRTYEHIDCVNEVEWFNIVNKGDLGLLHLHYRKTVLLTKCRHLLLLRTYLHAVRQEALSQLIKEIVVVALYTELLIWYFDLYFGFMFPSQLKVKVVLNNLVTFCCR